MPDKIGMMQWEEMDWRFADFEETGLIYHETEGEKLPSIFSQGLIPPRRENNRGFSFLLRRTADRKAIHTRTVMIGH